MKVTKKMIDAYMTAWMKAEGINFKVHWDKDQKSVKAGLKAVLKLIEDGADDSAPGKHCGAGDDYRECEASTFCKKYKRCGRA